MGFNFIVAAGLPLIIGLSVLGAVVLILLILVCVMISKRNNIVRLVNSTDEAWATIDVYLKKRYDLIPNLVSTVKGYAKHESETLENVISARNKAISAEGIGGKADAEKTLGGALRGLFALAESYPSLKADSHFLQLQSQLQGLENDLAQARKYYNGNVKAYNTKIQLFPDNIVASMMKAVKREYFEIDSAEQRENIKVEF